MPTVKAARPIPKAPNRADAIAAAIPPDVRVLADIGYDLGHVTWRVLTARPTLRVIGVEIQPDATERVTQRLAGFERGRDLAARFEARTGDGLEPLAVGEADAALFAGLGEPTMLRALAARPKVATGLGWLVLCPPTTESLLRPALEAAGRTVRTAAIAFEQGRFYEVLVAGPVGVVPPLDGDPVVAAWGEELFTSIDRQVARAFVDDIAERFDGAIKAGLRAYRQPGIREALGRKLALLDAVRERLA